MAAKIDGLGSNPFMDRYLEAVRLAASGDHAGARGILLAILADTGRWLPARHPISATVALALGEREITLGLLEEAVPHLIYAVKVLRMLPGVYPVYSLTPRYELGRCLRLQGRLNAALSQLGPASRGLEENLGPEDPKTISCLFERGAACLGLGDREAALPLLERAARRGRRHLVAGHPMTVKSEELVGMLREALGAPDMAGAPLQEA